MTELANFRYMPNINLLVFDMSIRYRGVGEMQRWQLVGSRRHFRLIFPLASCAGHLKS